MSDDLALNPDAAEEARAEAAFKDYLLRAPRSIDGLLTDYQEKNREFGRGSVPTTNRTTLYKWAKEYRWKERAAEHDKRVVQSDMKSYDALRTLRFDSLFHLSEGGVKALEELITSEDTPPKVKLDAVKTLFDRIGLSESLVQQVGPVKKADVPDPDATDDAIAKWLAEQRR
jgi:hypothetical protein